MVSLDATRDDFRLAVDVPSGGSVQPGVIPCLLTHTQEVSTPGWTEEIDGAVNRADGLAC